MSETLKNYASAIVAGNIQAINATLSAAVKLLPPGTNQPSEGKQKTSMTLSTVAAVVSNFKLVRTYDAIDGWHTILFEGLVDGMPVQFIDQVHIDESDLIDHIDIFLRPASLAQNLLGKVVAEIEKRLPA